MGATKGKLRRMVRFRIDKISSVDAGAQAAQGDVILKRQLSAKEREELAKRAAVLTLVDGHRHMLHLDSYDGESDHGSTTWEDEHSHPWIRTESDAIQVFDILTPGADAPHAHEVEAISKTDHGEEGLPAGSSTEGDPAGETQKREGDMTNATDKTADDKKKAASELEKLKTERGEAVAKAERFEKIVGLPEDHRAHFDTLDAAGEEAFLKADADARKAEVAAAVKKAADANPVVFTAADGTEFRKSDDARMVTMAQSNDAMAKQLATAETAAEDAAFAKRAGTELEHLTGTVEDRALLLKVIEKGIEDEKQREAVLKIVRASDLGVAELLKQRGTSTPAPEGSVDDQLDKLAKAYAADHKVTHEEAYLKVLETPDGQNLLTQSPNGAV